MKSRAGSAILELLTASTLLGIVLAACAVLMHTGAVVLRNTSEHTAADEALRTTAAVVRSELRPLTPSDLHGGGSDSISSRIARGIGIVCDAARNSVAVRYRGLRLPDPAKDSLLVLGEERTMTFQVAPDQNAHCATDADEQLVVIQPAVPVRIGTVVLLFETGAYHLAVHALRYRRGNEPRQPLTDELLDDRATHFSFDAQQRGMRLLLRANTRTVDAASQTHFRLLNP